MQLFVSLPQLARQWRKAAPCFLLLAAALLFTSCASGPGPYAYRFVPGRTAVIQNGYAVAPEQAPPRVREAIASANRIAGLPYRYGGGHRQEIDTAYDCSGSASFVLRGAGLIQGSMPSTGFRRYGQSGRGEWISVYARRDHTFLVIAGLRFDTGYGDTRGSGPRWSDRPRTTTGAVVRHPAGL